MRNFTKRNLIPVLFLVIGVTLFAHVQSVKTAASNQNVKENEAEASQHEISNFQWIADHEVNDLIFKNTAEFSLEEECGQNTPSPGFIENGYSNFGEIQIANDFVVQPNQSFSLENLSFNAMIEPDKTLNNVDVYFYTDSGTGPGSLISSQPDLIPDYITDLGEENGFNHVTVGVDLAESEFFQGNSFETIYWIGIQLRHGGGISYMEVTSTNMNTPNPVYLYSYEIENFFPAGGDPSDGVLTLEGTCSDLPECSGNPEPGTLMGPDSICSEVDFTLIVEDASQGASGLTYQWQQKSSNSDTWENIYSSKVFEITANIDEPTDFRFLVQCGDGESVATETISVDIKSQGQCHCIPVFSTGCNQFGDYIKDFVLDGENGTQIETLDTTCPPESYDDRTNESVDLAAGLEYTAQISAGATDEDVAVWIDFNDDGYFSQDELVGTVSDVGGSMKNLTIEIPANAQTGEHYMRIMLQYFAMPVDSCVPEGPWGMTRDYSVNIIAAEECSGTPVAGTANGPESICSETPFELTVEGYSQAGGVVFYWERSPEGQNDWTIIPDSDNFSQTIAEGINEPTDYRFYMECEFSGESAYSNVITVDVKPDTECYCTPIYYGGCSFDDAISGVIFEDASGEVIFENYSGCDTDNAYTDFTETTDAIGLIQGDSYTLTIETEAPDPGSEEIRGWIDFNNNGIFDEGEEILNTNGSGFSSDGKVSFELNIDENQAPGIHRMRLRLIYGASEIDPCDIDGYGEAEDYLIEVMDRMSVKEQNLHGISFYPNPVKDVLNFASKKAVKSVSVYNLMGQKVMNLNSEMIKNGQIDVTQLTTGTYVFRAVLKDGQMETFKVIKK